MNFVQYAGQNLRYDLPESQESDGFAQEGCYPEFQCRPERPLVNVGTTKDDFCIVAAPSHFAENMDAIGIRQAKIQDDCVETGFAQYS